MFAARYDPTAGLKRRHSALSESSGSVSHDGVDVSEKSDTADSQSEENGESDMDSDDSALENEPMEPYVKETDAAGVHSDNGIAAPLSTQTLEDVSHPTPEPMSESEASSESDSEPSSDPETEPSASVPSKHKGVFQKLRTSLALQKDDISEPSDDEIPTHDLAPLPQPALPRDKRLTATTNHISNLDWLATPTYASTTDTVAFTEMPLSASMIKNLHANDYTDAFSVQAAVLRLLLPNIQLDIRPDVGGDLLVNASTGSGKTLGYAIPIIESLRSRVVPRVRSIVLVPTKPLISQVKTIFTQLTKNTNLSVVGLRGDISIAEEAQKLENTPDILVSTPGRLVEHLNRNSMCLKSLRYLVIDEADRLLNQSFQNWCESLMSRIDVNVTAQLDKAWRPSVQKLVFSATLTTDAGRLAMLKLQRPRLIVVNDRHELVNELFSVPATLDEYKLSLGSARSSSKPLVLAKFLMKEDKLTNTLVFAKSNEASLRLCRLLELLFQSYRLNVNVAYLNSTNNSGSIRARVLRDFGNQTVHILVVTDLIARGIDIASITDVFNYDLPNSSRDYVHRVGRTARANNKGSAYTLCFGRGESKWFGQLVREMSRQQEVKDVEGSYRDFVTKEDETIYDTCLEELQKQVNA